jgi:mRNA-decapping enzyme C-terminus
VGNVLEDLVQREIDEMSIWMLNSGESIDLKQLPIPPTLSSSVESKSTINPLTKEQLQQSLIHLLQVSDRFIEIVESVTGVFLNYLRQNTQP